MSTTNPKVCSLSQFPSILRRIANIASHNIFTKGSNKLNANYVDDKVFFDGGA